MQRAEYGPNGVFAQTKYGKYQHRFKVDTEGNILWPLCLSIVGWVRLESPYPSDYVPKCPKCERRYRQAAWLPYGETRGY
jgi:hypothetical protein